MIFSFVGRKGDHVNVVINSEKLDLLVGGRGGGFQGKRHIHTHMSTTHSNFRQLMLKVYLVMESLLPSRGLLPARKKGTNHWMLKINRTNIEF